MQRINIEVDKNTRASYFEDYVNSIEMWCSANCSGGFDIEVSEAPTYHIPRKVTIGFEDAVDAAYFKLSPLWTEEIRK